MISRKLYPRRSIYARSDQSYAKIARLTFGAAQNGESNEEQQQADDRRRRRGRSHNRSSARVIPFTAHRDRWRTIHLGTWWIATDGRTDLKLPGAPHSSREHTVRWTTVTTVVATAAFTKIATVIHNHDRVITKATGGTHCFIPKAHALDLLTVSVQFRRRGRAPCSPAKSRQRFSTLASARSVGTMVRKKERERASEADGAGEGTGGKKEDRVLSKATMTSGVKIAARRAMVRSWKRRIVKKQYTRALLPDGVVSVR